MTENKQEWKPRSVLSILPFTSSKISLMVGVNVRLKTFLLENLWSEYFTALKLFTSTRCFTRNGQTHLSLREVQLLTLKLACWSMKSDHCLTLRWSFVAEGNFTSRSQSEIHGLINFTWLWSIWANSKCKISPTTNCQQELPKSPAIR